MSSAYIIANVEVTNPTQYEEYKKWSTEAMKAHGAEVCVRGGKVEVLEGDWHPARLVVVEFPSAAAAREWWNSPEYSEAKRIRQATSEGTLLILEGV